MNELALFAGAGGGILGGHLLGWRTVCAVERDAYAAQILAQRQNDGCLRPFPIWSDVTTFDGRPWRGLVDVVSGGFPCQDISAAGRGAGLSGQRSGLWSEMARVIGEVRPRYVYVENSPMLTSRGLGVVLGDLAEMGFDAEWGVVSAADTGAPHLRERIWIVASQCGGRLDDLADPTSSGLATGGVGGRNEADGHVLHMQPDHRSQDVAYAGGATRERNASTLLGAEAGMGGEGQYDGHHLERPATSRRRERAWDGRSWPVEPGLGRVVDGVAHRVDRLKAIGNGQVSRVAAAAWELLAPSPNNSPVGGKSD